jgi:hypothetical protein
MADHEVLIQQLNRHHATKQFDLLRKIAKEGENRLELESILSSVEQKSRLAYLQAIPATRTLHNSK